MKRILVVILLFVICFTNLAAAEGNGTGSWLVIEIFEEKYLGLNEENLSGMYLEYAESKITKEELRHAIGFKLRQAKARLLEVSDSNKELKGWRANKLKLWQTNMDIINQNIIDVEVHKIDENKAKAHLKEGIIKVMIGKYGWLQEVERYKGIAKEQKSGVNKKNNWGSQ